MTGVSEGGRGPSRPQIVSSGLWRARVVPGIVIARVPKDDHTALTRAGLRAKRSESTKNQATNAHATAATRAAIYACVTP